MTPPIPKKAILQTAATESYSKAGAAMDQARPLIAKLTDTEAEPSKPGSDGETAGDPADVTPRQGQPTRVGRFARLRTSKETP